MSYWVGLVRLAGDWNKLKAITKISTRTHCLGLTNKKIKTKNKKKVIVQCFTSVFLHTQVLIF